MPIGASRESTLPDEATHLVHPPAPKTSRSRSRDTSNFDAAPSFDAVDGLALRWQFHAPPIKSPVENRFLVGHGVHGV